MPVNVHEVRDFLVACGRRPAGVLTPNPAPAAPKAVRVRTRCAAHGPRKIRNLAEARWLRDCAIEDEVLRQARKSNVDKMPERFNQPGWWDSL
jgi:hypothetical protein